MITVIPAYQPDEALVEVVRNLRAARMGAVLVIDDGSGPDYRDVFARAQAEGAAVIGYPGNRGKGHALKEGFAEVMWRWPGEGVVCADADGQHTVIDVRAVADRLAADAAADATSHDAADDASAGHCAGDAAARVAAHATTHDAVPRQGPALAIVLGERALDTGVPLRSRLGNAATRLLFRLITGLRVQDTQTGLRGYPAALLPQLVRVPGARYEYELNVLLQAHAAGWRLISVPIQTVYLEGNASSHFRPLADSARVYAPLLKFCASSLVAFAVDAAGVLYLSALTGSLLVSVVGARAVSATVNYLVNRRLVFREDRARPARSSVLRYGALLVAMLAANWAVLSVFTGLGLALLPAKIVTDLSLFVVNYTLQHRVVFSARRRHRGGGADGQGSAGQPVASVLETTGPPLSSGRPRASA